MQSRLFAPLLVPALAVCAAVFGAGSSASAAAVVCDSPQALNVPAAGAVVGAGSADSCTEAALRAAVAGGGHVTFNCGGTSVTIPVTHEIPVSKTTVVDGGGMITLDGGGRNRILVLQSGTTLSVRNLRFVNGAAAKSTDRAVGSGGAVAGGYRTHVEVIASTFEANTAGLGGGAVMVGTDSTLTIVRSVFSGNSSWYGGAVYSLLSPLTVIDSTFTDNTTSNSPGLGDGGAIGTDGGGMWNTAGVIRICGSVIKHNTGHGSGGGAYLWAYAPQVILVERTTFEDNHATPNLEGGSLGGGARISIGPAGGNHVGSITVRDSSVLSNKSDGGGGGFYVDCAPTCTINNSTFYANSAAAYGGAIFGDGHHDNNVTFANNSAGSHGGALFGSNVVLTNTVFVGNAAHNPWGQAMSCSTTGTGAHVMQWLSSTRDGSTSCIPGATAANPQLAAPAANGGPTLTMMPAANSPVLGAGSACEPHDQRGAARGTSGCDLGAVQRVPVTPASATASASASAAPPAASASQTGSPQQALRAIDAGNPVHTRPASSIMPITLTGAGLVVAAALAVALAIRRRTRGRRPPTGSHRAAGTD